MHPKPPPAAVFLALIAVLTLGSAALAGACVEKVSFCEEFDVFAELYGPTCPEVEAWATECATNVDELNRSDLEARQDLDWCVDCYRTQYDDEDQDCSEAPLGNECPALLNATLDASCTWPSPAP